MSVEGRVAPGWEAVRTAFAANLSSGEDTGAAVAIRHRGEIVVELSGGSFDGGERPYDDQTLQLVFSSTKGITAIAVAICVQRGLLDYGAPVATYWPEFAAHGKESATVGQLLSHQCGLFSVQGDISLADALDWSTITARLADTAPEWPIGTAHGYHALTYGWLAGELVRRVDPAHRSIGAFVQDEIAGPVGAEFYIGLPASLEPRVAPILGEPLRSDIDDPVLKAMIERFLGPESNAGRALTLNGAFAGPGLFNTPQVHAAEIPAANGITNARSLATIYAATLAPVDGVRLIDDDVRDIARVTVTPPGEPDACLIMPTTFGMGFMTHGTFTPYAGPGSYGHPGAGGSVGFAQPERQLAFAYVMNQSARNLAGDLRAARLIEAAVAVIDGLG
ncbi:MAG: beta-lactamase family protein [Actinobacteria bacterium]|nr:beta-lactamase family protein [Actinomycetota bacterium]